MMRLRLLGVPGMFCLVLVLAACGSSNNSTSSSTGATTPAAPSGTTSSSTTTPAAPAGATKLALAANPQGELKYNTTSLSAPAGTISIVFTNKSPLAHNVTIEAPSGERVGATSTSQGGSQTLTVSLKAGTYKFFCSVPGHRMAGMEGTLTVH